MEETKNKAGITEEKQDSERSKMAGEAAGDSFNHQDVHQANSYEAQARERYKIKTDPRLTKMRGSFSVFGAASALYALFYTFCMFQNFSGITYPFFVAGTLFYFYFCMKKCEVPWKKDSIFYVVSLLLLGLSVCYTANVILQVISKTAIFLLTISFLLHQFYEDRKWGFLQYIEYLVDTILEMIVCLPFPFQDFFRACKNKKENPTGKVFFVIVGIIISIPILFVVLALLLSADEIFRSYFLTWFEWIDFWKVIQVILMFAAGFAVSYAFVAAMCRHSIVEREKKEPAGEPVIAVTVTSLLTIVYLVFCVIQIRYLFLGQSAEGLPEDFVWSQYAREGFFQLLAVCFINLALVLICLTWVKENKILKVILTVICGCTYIMTGSSAYRMYLYICNYHLTFLRLLVMWTLLLIAVFMAGLICFIYRKNFPLFRFTMVLLTVGYLIFVFAKPDYLIASYNVGQMKTAYAGSKLSWDISGDVDYLFSLSADAVPVIAEEEAYNYFIEHDKYGDYERKYERWAEKAQKRRIRSFNISWKMAENALQNVGIKANGE